MVMITNIIFVTKIKCLYYTFLTTFVGANFIHFGKMSPLRIFCNNFTGYHRFLKVGKFNKWRFILPKFLICLSPQKIWTSQHSTILRIFFLNTANVLFLGETIEILLRIMASSKENISSNSWRKQIEIMLKNVWVLIMSHWIQVDNV